MNKTPPDREAFEERAGILEFDGGLPRAEAERKAAFELADALLSSCCKAPLSVAGGGQTHWFECARCGSPA